MPAAFASTIFLIGQCILLGARTAGASVTNSTSNSTIPDLDPISNVTIPANAYPTSTNSSSVEDGSTSKNATLSDEQRNPYWPGLDEYPLWNQSASSQYHSNYSFLYYPPSGSNTTISKLKKRDNVLLRIMPLGASITQGFDTTQHPDQSTQGGYRQPLREQLRFSGWQVNFVGSKENGLFADNQNEGHPGYVIDQVKSAMDPVLKDEKPNLVLINAGTNDCTQADSQYGGISYVQGVGQRYQELLDKIYEESPNVTIIMSTILPNYGADPIPSYVNLANTQLRQLFAQYQKQGAKIGLAEMNSGWLSYPADYSDTTHPNDQGYLKMAEIWWEAFQSVAEAGYLIEPIDTGLGGDNMSTTCLPSASGFGSAITTMGDDFGYNDGAYVHSSSLTIKDWILPSQVFNHSMLDYNQFHFAEIERDYTDMEAAYDEIILIMDAEDREFASTVQGAHIYGYFNYMSNIRNGDYLTAAGWQTIDIVGQGTPECLSRGVRFADINGDGLDDFICLNPSGEEYVSINNGGIPPTFTFHGRIYKDRFAQGDVRLGDIDGDGRMDYCGLDSDGSMYCHRNGGNGLLPTAAYKGYWQGILLSTAGPTFDANTLDTGGVRLIDINGDGRSDWVWVAYDGSTTIMINQRGSRSDGPGLKPHWVKASKSHGGFPSETGNLRKEILFGRVYGSGRQDYIRFSETKKSSATSGNRYTYSVNVWKNTGSGGTRVNGDGVQFCDMTGDGKDDMLYIWDGGMVDVWPRSTSSSDDAPSFKFKAQVAKLAVDRRWIQLADWDGDGRCDLLVTDHTTGDVTLYKNTGTGDSITIGAGQTVVSGKLCPQKYPSPSETDLAVRFGDLDGDGRADYLCMDPNGRTVGWLNKASGLTALNQIKVSVGFDRPNHRWADVNGDGLVDFLWVDKHTGNVQFWENNGFTPSIGSSMNWIGYPSSWTSGKERGQNILFPKIQSNSKRVDYQITLPITGRGTAYHNKCSGDGGVGPGPDDGAGAVDPGLPKDPYNNGGNTVAVCCSKMGIQARGFDFAYL